MQRGVELVGYASFVGVVRVVVFTLGVVAGAVALVDWAVRTRRLNPFGPIARTFRRFVEPLMLPVERRVVRAGGQPASAPWWTLVFVVVGGLLFLGALNVDGGLIVQAMYGMQSAASAALVLVSWTFGLLRLALLVRVLSSWFQISPWSRWIRWSYVLTDWMLAPIRRLLPDFGPLDLSPLVAYFLLGILQSILGIP